MLLLAGTRPHQSLALCLLQRRTLLRQHSRPRNSTMTREPLNVVVLGASFAGLGAAHQFLDDVLPSLSTFEDAPTYRLVLISPSTHLYWNISAPRTLVSDQLVLG
jgi:hypothetical protein